MPIGLSSSSAQQRHSGVHTTSAWPASFSVQLLHYLSRPLSPVSPAYATHLPLAIFILGGAGAIRHAASFGNFAFFTVRRGGVGGRERWRAMLVTGWACVGIGLTPF